jgi:hypothetical protein
VLSTGLLLLGLTLLGAAVLVAHLALLVATFRAEKISTLERWLALVPPLLPVIAFRAGLKASATVWLFLVAGYVVLRFVG